MQTPENATEHVYAIKMGFDFGEVNVHAIVDASELKNKTKHYEFETVMQACAEQTLLDAGWSTPFPKWSWISWNFKFACNPSKEQAI